MARFTRRHLRRRIRRGEAPPQVETGGSLGDVIPPVRDPERTVERAIPTFARCMWCGRRRTKKPEWFTHVVMNPEDTPPRGLTGSICEDCHARIRAAHQARHAQHEPEGGEQTDGG